MGIRITSVIGNRPQFIKAAAVSRLLARAPRRDACAHRPALRRRDVASVLRGAGRPGSRRRAGGWLGHEHRADGANAHGARAGARQPAGHGARLRRHELHSRGRARGGPGSGAAGTRGGRHALVRPRDAGGAQPRPHGPRERHPLLLDGDGGGEPGEGIGGGRDPPRGRRDGRRVAGIRADRGRALPGARGAGARPGRLPARDGSSCRQRGPAGPARGARGADRGASRQGRLPAAPAHREAPRRDRASRPARRGGDPHSAARLPRLPRARTECSRRPDRFGRRAEGGVPARDAVHHAPRHHRVGRDRGRGLERAGRSGRRRGHRSPGAPRRPTGERPSLYGGGTAAERIRDVLDSYTPRP